MAIISSFRYRLRRIKYEIKSICQRFVRGYSHGDIMDLHITLAKFILPRLKAYKKNSKGWRPASLTLKEWNSNLKFMIMAFEEIVKDDLHIYNSKKEAAQQLKIKRGLLLFQLYYQQLWY